jgi:alkylation response protein AidB-like acyl-CoA dehydrogenase
MYCFASYTTQRLKNPLLITAKQATITRESARLGVASKIVTAGCRKKSNSIPKTTTAMTSETVDPLILETVERACANEIHKYQEEAYYNTVPRDLFRALCNAGLGGLAIPEQYGGLAANAATTAAIFEVIARYDLGPAIFISVHAMVCSLISRHGTTEQHQRLLPRLASGELLAAFALTEPNAGSDAAAIATEAVSAQNGFVLRGEKCYITSAGFADIYLVFARTPTDPINGSEQSHISAFLVPACAAGLSISKPERKMGCELSPIASLTFDNVYVPASDVVGSLHQGFKVALSGLASGRVNIAACANGLSLAAIEASKKQLRERTQFGKALAEFQGLQFILADMFIQTEAARLLTQKAAETIDRERIGAETADTSRLSSSTAKCFATDTAMQVTTNAVQLLGGAGYIKEYQVERLMREAKMLQIVEGTNQIQRIIIAREIL